MLTPHLNVFLFLPSEVVEQASSMASMLMGEMVENVSGGIDTYSIRQPLGVCAGICPFNFPAMIPLWVGRGHWGLWGWGNGSGDGDGGANEDGDGDKDEE